MSLERDDILNSVKKADTQNCSKNTTFFVSTFNPLIEDPHIKIRQAVNVYNGFQSDESRQIKIQSSYRICSSLKSLLMFSKNSEQYGVFKCSDGCTLCKDYLLAGDTIKLKSGTVIKPNERFDCLSRNLLYLAVCGGCNEAYLGETGDQLANRFTVHRQQSKIGAQMQSVKADRHFRICGGDKYDVFPFLRLRKNCITYRRLVEDSYIKKLNPKLNANVSTFAVNSRPS